MGRRFANILETVGNTPVVRINKLAPADVNLFVKIEAFNPLGSVKDRLALGVIEDAERRGELKPGQTVIEATSGNTGIGLAMVCAAEGLSAGRHHGRDLQRRAPQADALPRRQGGAHAGGAARPSAWSNKASRAGRRARLVPHAPVRERSQCRHALAHHRAGDPRRLRRPRQLDYWVTGYGTGGTLKGVARVLAAERRTPRSSSANRTTRRC